MIAMLMALSGPAIQALGGAGSTSQAASDFSSVLSLARSYAVAHNTFVRVGIAEVTTPGSEKLVVMPLFAADGSLEQSTASDMADPARWPALGRPLILENFRLAEGEVDGTVPTTSGDDLTSGTDIPDFHRSVPGKGTALLRFDRCIQFNPTGEARTIVAIPSRHIKIPVDKIGGQAGRNPFLLRVSAGSIRILRAGEGI